MSADEAEAHAEKAEQKTNSLEAFMATFGSPARWGGAS